MNLNQNLTKIILEKILLKNTQVNHTNLINHLKIIIDYSKYDICYKKTPGKYNSFNYHTDFYTYYFKYRVRYKKKIDKKFVDYYIKTNNMNI